MTLKDFYYNPFYDYKLEVEKFSAEADDYILIYSFQQGQQLIENLLASYGEDEINRVTFYAPVPELVVGRVQLK